MVTGVTKEDVLRVVKERGPIIPNDIKKEINAGDTFVIGAVLSELSNKGIVKISHTKIGGSPAYYTPGQEEKLQRLREWLNEKDQRTFDLLKEEKVIRDGDYAPLTRVSLRNIKDFARPIEVTIKGEKEVFWKWYLVPGGDAEKRIREIVAPHVSKKEVEEPKPIPALVERPKDDEKDEGDKELKEKDDAESFIQQVKKYFWKHDIEILEEETVRKGSDLEFVVKVPSGIGEVEYFCKARNKKKCNDGDLSSAFIEGQSRKLPVLFLMTGKMTKKAEEMLKNQFKGMVVKKLE